MNALWRNSIYFPMQDTNPNIVATPPVSITYTVDGLAPCRRAIIDVKNMPLYSCGTSQGLQESQLVLYEGTNIIDVYVKKDLRVLDGIVEVVLLVFKILMLPKL